jgi:hypothetical protein
MTKHEPIKAGDTLAGVHRKLSAARQAFHALELKKSGKNTFAGYSYFELGDFLIPALTVLDQFGLSATVSFTADLATMTIVDLDNPQDTIVITSPMGSAALKGCHEVQNIGAVETYQRRYLWVAALEIVEHDALDKTTGKDEPTRATNGNGHRANQANDRDAPFPAGPCKNKTALKDAGRALWADVMACGDSDELCALLVSHKPLIDQLKEGLPQWWNGGTRDGEPYEGLGQVIERLERDFAGIAENGVDMRGRSVVDAG